MTTTPAKGYTLPVVGGDNDTWGTELNTNLSTLDSNLGGGATINVSGSVDVTANPTQAMNLIQNLIGTISGNIKYKLPAVGGFYLVANNTTGAFSVTLATTAVGAATVVVPQGQALWVVSDGSNIILGSPAGWQEVATFTPVGASTVDIALPAGFKRHRLTIQQCVLTGAPNAQLGLTSSANSGGSFATSYTNIAISQNTSNTAVSGSGGSASYFPLASQISNVGGSITSLDATYEIWPGAGTQGFVVRGNAFSVASIGNSSVLYVSGSSTTVGANLVRLQMQSGGGTISGVITLESLP